MRHNHKREGEGDMGIKETLSQISELVTQAELEISGEEEAEGDTGDGMPQHKMKSAMMGKKEESDEEVGPKIQKKKMMF